MPTHYLVLQLLQQALLLHRVVVKTQEVGETGQEEVGGEGRERVVWFPRGEVGSISSGSTYFLLGHGMKEVEDGCSGAAKYPKNPGLVSSRSALPFATQLLCPESLSISCNMHQERE